MSAIDSAYRRLEEDIFKPILIQSIPTHFSLTIRIRKALENPDTGITEIASLIKGEPAVAAAVVGSANSALNYSGVAINNVEKAVSRIGLAAVKRICRAIAIQQLSRSKELMPFAGYARLLWLHALYSAASSEVIADKVADLPKDEAQFRGLLSTLGGFYLLYLASKQPELSNDTSRLPRLIEDWHRVLTMKLLGNFGYDASFSECYRYSFKDELLSRPPKTWSELIAVSNRLSCEHYHWQPTKGSQDNGIYEAHRAEIVSVFERLQADFQ